MYHIWMPSSMLLTQTILELFFHTVFPPKISKISLYAKNTMISQSLTMSFYFSCGSIRLKFCFYIFYRVCNKLFIKFTLNFSKSIKAIRIRTPKVSEQRFISREPANCLIFPSLFQVCEMGKHVVVRGAFLLLCG